MQETITIKSNGRVYLILQDKSYKPFRLIGYIRERTFYTFRKPENQFFIKLNSIGMNYKLLNQGGSHFDKIRIEYGLEVLETTREFYLEFGEFLHFSKNKLDKQIFLKLELFGMDKVQEWDFEKTLSKSENLNETVTELELKLF